jgi:hypothetical protein
MVLLQQGFAKTGLTNNIRQLLFFYLVHIPTGIINPWPGRAIIKALQRRGAKNANTLNTLV